MTRMMSDGNDGKVEGGNHHLPTGYVAPTFSVCKPFSNLFQQENNNCNSDEWKIVIVSKKPMKMAMRKMAMRKTAMRKTATRKKATMTTRHDDEPMAL
jgi:hypothetical protein